jgi:aminopeptidase N
MVRSFSFFFLVVFTLSGCAVLGPNSNTKIKTVNLDTISVRTTGPIDIYRKTNSLPFDLIHTKLDVDFDWLNSYMNGVAELTVSPHFYPQDSLVLDAVSMGIQSVEQKINGVFEKADFKYPGKKLIIKHNELTRTDTAIFKINYIAKPEEQLADETGSAIRSDKGLYFINPRGEELNKPKQIWTQGETQASSHWFPTFDSPNVKSSQEIAITVDSNYTTLSNGELDFSSINENGTRTDYWSQENPHAPYLFMMAVGEFAVVEDTTTEFPIRYLVESDFKDDAYNIFKHTPEMVSFFSKKLGFEYPWDKFDQIVVRDYVSGAMENTSAVIYGEFVQKNSRELLDGDNQDIVVHELSHHWFGDLVTCESWSNLTLNESFATYAPYLWRESKYGKDDADHYLLKNLNSYFDEAKYKNVNLVRFNYTSKDKMFDRHSYSKGSNILHMLRGQIGDDAFFAGLQNYLTTNQFTAAEAHQLRLAFEEVTGTDLTTFFNQWYYSAGNPIIEINYWSSAPDSFVGIELLQLQDLTLYPTYELIIEVEVFYQSSSEIQTITLSYKEQTFKLNVKEQPINVIVDPKGSLLVKWVDNKKYSWLSTQYNHTNHYRARFAGFQSMMNNVETDTAAKELVFLALNDPHWSIREKAFQALKFVLPYNENRAKTMCIEAAVEDPKSQVRTAALNVLNNAFSDDELLPFLEQKLADESYLVLGEALNGIYRINPDLGVEKATEHENENSTVMTLKLCEIYAHSSAKNKTLFFKENFINFNGTNKSLVAKYWVSYLQKNLVNSTTLQAVPEIEKATLKEKNWWIRFYLIESLVELKYFYRDIAADQPDMLYSEVASEIEKAVNRVLDQETNQKILSTYR